MIGDLEDDGDWPEGTRTLSDRMMLARRRSVWVEFAKLVETVPKVFVKFNLDRREYQQVFEEYKL